MRAPCRRLGGSAASTSVAHPGAGGGEDRSAAARRAGGRAGARAAAEQQAAVARASCGSWGTAARLATVGVGGVDAADQRRRPVDRGPRRRSGRGSDAPSESSGSVRGSNGSAAARSLPVQLSSERGDERSHRRRDAEHDPARDRVQCRRATPSPWRRSATSRSALPSPTLRANAAACGTRGEEGVGAFVDVADAAERRGGDLAAEPIDAPPTARRRAPSLGRSSRGGGGEPGDAAADDEHAPVSHASLALGERRRGRRAPPSRSGSSLTHAVRSNAQAVPTRPAGGPRCRGRTAPRGGRRRSRRRTPARPSTVGSPAEAVDDRRGCRASATARACARRSARRSPTARPRPARAAAGDRLGGRAQLGRGTGRRRRRSAPAASGR